MENRKVDWEWSWNIEIQIQSSNYNVTQGLQRCEYKKSERRPYKELENSESKKFE